jgi:hypothetical protein
MFEGVLTFSSHKFGHITEPGKYKFFLCKMGIKMIADIENQIMTNTVLYIKRQCWLLWTGAK